MAASLCCRSATTSSVQRATSAAVLQEQQVRTDFVKSIQGAQGQMGGHRRTGIVSSFILLKKWSMKKHKHSTNLMKRGNMLIFLARGLILL